MVSEREVECSNLRALCLVFSHGGCDSHAEPLYSPMEAVIPMKEPARASGDTYHNYKGDIC